MSEQDEAARDAARKAEWQRQYAEVGLEPPRHESDMWNLGFDAGAAHARAAAVDEFVERCEKLKELDGEIWTVDLDKLQAVAAEMMKEAKGDGR